jgi:DNA-directed RNA polymerase subunit H
MTTKKAVIKHEIVPLHERLSDAEKEKLLSELGINFKDLPKIYKSDAAVAEIEVKQGDIIKITRKSSTAGETIFFRGVIDA